MPSKPKWTVLTYIAAHNNLAQFGERSLRGYPQRRQFP